MGPYTFAPLSLSVNVVSIKVMFSKNGKKKNTPKRTRTTTLNSTIKTSNCDFVILELWNYIISPSEANITIELFAELPAVNLQNVHLICPESLEFRLVK